MATIFENKIKTMGYKIEDGDIECKHEKDSILFVHACSCCYLYDNNINFVDINIDSITKLQNFRYKDLVWRKDITCSKCLSDYLGVLYCGGHYTTEKIFDIIEESFPSTPEYITYEVNDPNQLVYSEEDWKE